jgi:uncharacterized protein
MAYIDLDELPELLGGRLLRRSPGFARFRRHDYLGESRIPLAEAVLDMVAARTGARPCGPVRLLGNLSALGHCFNPVSFYFCMDDADDRVSAVVAEVTNTPWGERHSYILGANDASHEEASAEQTGAEASPLCPRVLAGGFVKQLHVSPFMGMDHRYEWRMTSPAQTLSIHISSVREGRVAFDATLDLRRRELTRGSLCLLAAATLRTLASIYAQAAVLKLKGVPVRPHPGVGLA